MKPDQLSAKAHDATAKAAEASKGADWADGKSLRTAAKAHIDAADAHKAAGNAQMDDARDLKGQAASDAWQKGQAHRDQAGAHEQQADTLASKADQC